jgi:hypothetical protein
MGSTIDIAIAMSIDYVEVYPMGLFSTLPYFFHIVALVVIHGEQWLGTTKVETPGVVRNFNPVSVVLPKWISIPCKFRVNVNLSL